MIRPGEQGRYVVKDPRNSSYYTLGEEEHFLLAELDGTKSAEVLSGTFEERFGQPLPPEELDSFLQQVRTLGFLEPDPVLTGAQEPRGSVSATPRAAAPRPRRRQSILYWRKSLFDPDQFFDWLEPKIRFFWTPAFLAISAATIIAAGALVWVHRSDLTTSFGHVLRWETVAIVWLVMLGVLTCHEFAHGLTCKHHGGEVREVGFLLMYLLPCFYCNVSDAWLFREKSKRLWVTLAGGYFELYLWALAVFIWRITPEQSLTNYLAFIVFSVCGVQTLFNFNPLLKLDGYYLLSDGLGIPNLHGRALGLIKATFRWIVWGAPRPSGERRKRLLFTYGVLSWCFSLFILATMLVGVLRFSGRKWGLLGTIGAGALWFVAMRGLFRGFLGGEVRKMIFKRTRRAVLWVLVLGGLSAALVLIEMEDWAGGSFKVRSASRVELRAEQPGYLKDVYFDEGEQVPSGAIVARLEVPDLATSLAKKLAETREVEAKLSLLLSGPRAEEVAEQRLRVERGIAWRDLAAEDLKKAKEALGEELARLEQLVVQFRAEQVAAADALKRTKALLEQGLLAEQEYLDADRKQRIALALLNQARAEKRVREKKGVIEAQAELARRDKELAEARAALTLLLAGTRPEEIDMERAHLARLREEVAYLEVVREKLTVYSPVPGVITTPRLKEKAGQYVREGEPIAVVEDPGGLEVEIEMAEEEVARVLAGQSVRLKARALPFETFQARVDRIAPTASCPVEKVALPGAQGAVTVYCRLERSGSAILPGMTGYARVATGHRPVGRIIIDRALRFLRTEFWW